MIRPRDIVFVVLLFFSAAPTSAERYELNFDTAPSSLFLDRWVYPFNVSPGSRIQAPTFGAVGSEGVDERDGQFLIVINTKDLGIAAELDPRSYKIDDARLIVTEAVGGYTFDPSYDRFTTYLPSSSPLAEPDPDSGRPIELYGAGLRNDFTSFGFPDGGTSTPAPVFSAGSPFGASDRGTRNVFASDALGNDVSNNIDALAGGLSGFDPTPFAVGRAIRPDDTPLTPGSLVSAGTRMVFDLQIADPAVQAYLQNGLAQGQLGFVISSLHDAGLLGGDNPFVNLATANHFAVAGPKFEMTMSMIDVGLPGDFDANGTLDINDVNQLTTVIRNGSNDVALDLSGDSLVTTADLNLWVHDLFGSYFGDANLDGEFTSGDLVAVFSAGQYEDSIPGNSTWSTGDWNADGEFNTSDLVTAFQDGGYEQGPRATVAAVPEPNSLFAWILGALSAVSLRRIARK